MFQDYIFLDSIKYRMIESVDITLWLDHIKEVALAIMGAITAISAVFAAYKDKAAKQAAAETQKAKAETEAVQNFFDPENTTVMSPPAGTPERSWKMNAATRGWILGGHEGEELASMEKQIDDAEAAGLVDYTISFRGGYYKISYGMISEAARWEK